MGPSSPIWTLFEDPAAVAAALAGRIAAAATRAIAERGRFRLVLAGGRTPQAAYARLPGINQDWSRWEILFGDERCLPADHAERNSRMAAAAFLDQTPIPADQIHPIPAELGPEAGARAYEQIVAGRLPFDLVLLGMGEDGHTASLFPGRTIDPEALVVPVHGAPKPPPERISLGLAALGRAERLLIIVTGPDKREALRRWRSGEDLPIAAVGGGANVEVLIDRAAMPPD
jgi:6-phosphogluconolactonase